jgi:hypothetical protein
MHSRVMDRDFETAIEQKKERKIQKGIQRNKQEK